MNPPMNMIPTQNFPLYAVALRQPTAAVMVVIGWREAESGVAPVLLPIGAVSDPERVRPRMWTTSSIEAHGGLRYFTDQAEAERVRALLIKQLDKSTAEVLALAEDLLREVS